MWFTLWQAVVSTVLTLAVGLPIAYVLHRYRLPGRRVLLAVVTVPFVLPTVVVGTAFRAVLPPPWIGTVAAILLAHVFFNFAVVVRVVGGLWAHLDPRYDQAARTLGRDPLARLPYRHLAAAPTGGAGGLGAGLLLHLHVVRGRAGAGWAEPPDPGGRDLPPHGSAARPVRGCGPRAAAGPGLGLVLLVSARAAGPAGRPAAQPPGGEVLGPVRGPPPGCSSRWCWWRSLLIAVPMVALVARSLRVRDGWGLAWWRTLFADAGDHARRRRRRPPCGSPWRTPWRRWWSPWSSAGWPPARSRTPGAAPDAGDLADAAAGRLGGDGGLRPALAFGRPPLDLRGSWSWSRWGTRWSPSRWSSRSRCPCCARSTRGCARCAATLGASPGAPGGRSTGARWPVRWRVGAGLAAAVSLGEFGATAFLARSDEPTLPVVVVRLLGRPGEANVGTAAAAATLLMVVTAAVVLLADRWRDRAGGLAVTGRGLRRRWRSDGPASPSYASRALLDRRRPRRSGPTRSSRCSARAGRASPRCCAWSRGCSRPTSGTVSWDGVDLAGTPDRTGAASGWCSRTRLLFPHLDVAGNVAYGLARPDCPRAERRARVAELLELVELPGYGPRRSPPCPAARRSGWRWPGRWPLDRGCCCSTSRSAPSTATCATGWPPTYGPAAPLGTPAIHVTHDLAEAELVADRVVRLVADHRRGSRPWLIAGSAF